MAIWMFVKALKKVGVCKKISVFWNYEKIT